MDGTVADEAGLVRGFDLRALPPAFYEDPYPFFRALRRHSPVHCLPDGSWFLTRHADPRTTEHYDRARGNLDRHGVHFLTAYVAGV